MAFNVLEYLKDGKVDFVYRETPSDYQNLILLVRESPNRIEIINGFLPKLKETRPDFCRAIIYDIPEFACAAYELLDIKNLTPEMLDNILRRSPTLGLRILSENLDTFLKQTTPKYEKYLFCIAKYAFDSNNRDLIHKLSRYPNLHIRYLFMNYLIKKHPKQIDTIYDDITKYLTSVTYEPYEQLTFLEELMAPAEVSKLAVLLLVNNRADDYQKLKDFILKNYKYNYLASELLKYRFFIDPDTNEIIRDSDSIIAKKDEAFNKDADSLFKTSGDYRFSLYLDYSKRISQELLDDFAHRIRFFLNQNQNQELENIYLKGLGSKLEEWSKKYMDLSQSKDYGFKGIGTTCSCFRIGDYVIKLVRTKWSYEDEICPNLYLIAKNYEEIYLRDKKGIVIGGLEVQKYLTRKATDIDPKYFRYFDLALDRLGYRRTDTLTKGCCGENTMLLDTYRDADCPNPEKVPVWFKGCPLVLVDRDRIYPKNKPYIKELKCGWY